MEENIWIIVFKNCRKQMNTNNNCDNKIIFYLAINKVNKNSNKLVFQSKRISFIIFFLNQVT